MLPAGVLTSEFFLNNKRFLGKIPLKPDAALRTAFFDAVKQAQELAQLRLDTTPDDTNALFAMALSLGMEADYASLIDKHQMDSLKKTRDADTFLDGPGSETTLLGTGKGWPWCPLLHSPRWPKSLGYIRTPRVPQSGDRFLSS